MSLSAPPELPASEICVHTVLPSRSVIQSMNRHVSSARGVTVDVGPSRPGGELIRAKSPAAPAWEHGRGGGSRGLETGRAHLDTGREGWCLPPSWRGQGAGGSSLDPPWGVGCRGIGRWAEGKAGGCRGVCPHPLSKQQRPAGQGARPRYIRGAGAQVRGMRTMTALSPV